MCTKEDSVYGKETNRFNRKENRTDGKEGRGQGTGEDYKPWINIQDFPSNGLSTRGKGWKTNRIHQFLSKLERDYFYVLEWNNIVIDIREQFPLIREDTWCIANEKGLNIQPTRRPRFLL